MPEAPSYSYPNNYQQSPRKGRWIYWRIVLILLVIFGGLSYLFIRGIFPFHTPQTSSAAFIGYQAVFLDNNQVYFGTIKSISGGFLDLQSVYYLQTPASTSQQTNALSLVNLSSAIHGPDDEMFIPLTHVLFYENLSPTSKVVQTIESHG